MNRKMEIMESTNRKKSKRIVIIITLLLLLSLALAACGNSNAGKPKPIDEEVDVCAGCNMTVMDNPFATQIVTNDGEYLKFDDIGCMAVYTYRNDPDGTAFVRDFYTDNWTEGEKALYASTEDIKTPMGSGFITFESQENLDEFLSQYNADEVTWPKILDIMKERKENSEGHGSM